MFHICSFLILGFFKRKSFSSILSAKKIWPIFYVKNLLGLTGMCDEVLAFANGMTPARKGRKKERKEKWHDICASDSLPFPLPRPRNS
jgi:hypothetical protein